MTVRGGRVSLLVLLVLLCSCGVGNGRCEIPAGEDAVRRAIVLNSLRRGFSADNIVQPSAEQYLRDNPGCCKVAERSVGLLERLFWDRYSLPRYDAEASYAYREGASVIRYSRHGQADSCGRIPDEFGWMEVIEGPNPRQVCADGRTLAESGASFCAAAAPPPHVAVPIAEANRLARLKAGRSSRAPQ